MHCDNWPCIYIQMLCRSFGHKRSKALSLVSFEGITSASIYDVVGCHISNGIFKRESVGPRGKEITLGRRFGATIWPVFIHLSINFTSPDFKNMNQVLSDYLTDNFSGVL